MLALKIAPMPDWFMMKYPVSKYSDLVEAFGEVLSYSDVARHIRDNRLQHPRPEYFFVSHVKQACPKTEGQFRDYPSCVERFFTFEKSSFCFLYLVEFWRVQYAWQVKPSIGFEVCCGGVMNSVSEADFQTLKRRIKAFRQCHIPSVMGKQLRVVIAGAALTVGGEAFM